MKERLLYTERTVKTFMGHYIDVFDPDLDTICIEDISHSLSHTPRWGGHTKRFYSVAQHSFWMAVNVPNKFKLEALLHDGTEAYIGDMPKPIKRHMPDFNRIEGNLDKAIRNKFGLPEMMSPVVKEWDKKALEWEWKHIKENDLVIPLEPSIASHMFLELFKILTK